MMIEISGDPDPEQRRADRGDGRRGWDGRRHGRNQQRDQSVINSYTDRRVERDRSAVAMEKFHLEASLQKMDGAKAGRERWIRKQPRSIGS